jgi:hypothetical protein
LITCSQTAICFSSRGMKTMADTVFAGGGRDALLGHFLAEEAVGDLDQDAAPSPISGSAPTAPRWSRFFRICRPCLTIWWTSAVLHMGDEADAAGIVFVARIVQTLCVHSQFSATFLSSNGQISAVQQKAQQE